MGVRRIRKSLKFFCHLEIFCFWNWISSLKKRCFYVLSRRERKKKKVESSSSNKRHTSDGETKKKSMNILPKYGHKYISGQTVVKSVNVMSRLFFSLFGDYEQFMALPLPDHPKILRRNSPAIRGQKRLLNNARAISSSSILDRFVCD